MISLIIENSVSRPVKQSPEDISKPLKSDNAEQCRLEEYRGYVSYLVRQGCPEHLWGRVEPEDLVQDVLLKVWRSDPDFSGRSEGERLSFLRKTCSSVLKDTIRRFDRGKRKASLDQSLDGSSARLEQWLAAVQSSPSQRASKHEQLLRLARAFRASGKVSDGH